MVLGDIVLARICRQHVWLHASLKVCHELWPLGSGLDRRGLGKGLLPLWQVFCLHNIAHEVQFSEGTLCFYDLSVWCTATILLNTI